jgi:flagellar hook assembly protein FlgD
VSAADNLASGITAAEHRSSASIAFEVTDNPALHVTRTFLFPSPTTSIGPGSGGRFVVDAPGDSVNVLLKIYSVSGKLIRVLDARGGLGQIQIPWDGRDSGGFPLATGVYLYRVHVNPREADGTSSARQKAIAEGRFVIHGR